jgi:hypothetical protein
MHVLVPTCYDYEILIRFDQSSKASCFRIAKAKIGDREIVINKGARIFYPDEATIRAFLTDSNESFRFIAQTAAEKSDAKLKREGANVTNIIDLELQPCLEIKPKEPERQSRSKAFEEMFGAGPSFGGSRSYSAGPAFGFGGDGRHAKSFSFGDEPLTRGAGEEFCFGGQGPAPVPASAPAAGDARPDHNGQKDIDVDRERRVSPERGSERERERDSDGKVESVAKRLKGGATVSGGHQVDDVRTVKTASTFDEVGKPVRFLIQLMTDETDETLLKVNAAYYIADTLRKEFQEMKAKIEALRDKALAAESHLRRVRTSIKRPDPEDMLFKFDELARGPTVEEVD